MCRQHLGLPHLRPSAKIPDVVLEHVVTLYRELKGRTHPSIVTREEARIANSDLRAEMRKRGNYFREIEAVAADVVAAVGYRGQAALTEGDIQGLAAHFGFSLHRGRFKRSVVSGTIFNLPFPQPKEGQGYSKHDDDGVQY